MFDKIIDRLRKNGWHEDLPLRSYWRYYKKNWRCYLNLNTGTVSFIQVNFPKKGDQNDAAVL